MDPNTLKQNTCGSISKGPQVPPRFISQLPPRSMSQGRQVLQSNIQAPVMIPTPRRMSPAEEMEIERNQSVLSSTRFISQVQPPSMSLGRQYMSSNMQAPVMIPTLRRMSPAEMELERNQAILSSTRFGRRVLLSNMQAPVMIPTPRRMSPAEEMKQEINQYILSSTSSAYLSGTSSHSPAMTNLPPTASRARLNHMVTSPFNVQATPASTARIMRHNTDQNIQLSPYNPLGDHRLTVTYNNMAPQASVIVSNDYLTVTCNNTVPRASQVSLRDRDKKWVAQVYDSDNRNICLGAYFSEEKAARAHDTAPVCFRGFQPEVLRKLNCPDTPPEIPNKECQPFSPEEIKERPRKRANRLTTGPNETLSDIPNKEGQPFSKDEIKEEMKEQPRKRAKRLTTGRIETMPAIPNKEGLSKEIKEPERKLANQQTTGTTEAAVSKTESCGATSIDWSFMDEERPAVDWSTVEALSSPVLRGHGFLDSSCFKSLSLPEAEPDDTEVEIRLWDYSTWEYEP